MPDHVNDAADVAGATDVAGDAGVLRRVRRRTSRAASALAAIAVALVVGGWLWPHWFAEGGAALLGGAAVAACLVATAALARRARLWSLAEEEAQRWPAASSDDERWSRGTCAEPRALHGTGGPSFWRRARRHPRHVLPLRTEQGPLADGEAVTLHGRPDAVLPCGGDALSVRALTARGPFLVGRPGDGALFVADRWTFSSL